MIIGAVFEVVVNTLFFAQALDKVQVGLVVLGAVVALWLGAAELEAVGIGLDAVVAEYPGDDLRHRQVLENALVGAVTEMKQVRNQIYMVARQALAGIALGDAVDQAVDAFAVACEAEEGWLLQQAVDIQVWAFADQFQLEMVRLADALDALEGQDLEIVAEARDSEGEVGLVGGGEHPMFLMCSVMLVWLKATWLGWARADYRRLGRWVM